MGFRTALTVGCFGFLGFLALLHAQKPFKEYPAVEYNDFPLPTDWKDQRTTGSGRAFAIPISSVIRIIRVFALRANRPWPGQWTMDYPRSDRHLLAGVRRLTRIDSRSVEQVVDLDGTGDVYNWPLMYAVEVGHWLLPQDQANQLREYLLRGGFLMVDDFHGSEPYPDYATREPLNEWANVRRQHPPRLSRPLHRGHPRRTTRFFTPSTTCRIAFRFPARKSLKPASPTKKAQPAKCRIGVAFATTRAGSWSPSATTWI